MAKTALQFSCQSCGAVYARWQGRCSACGEWNTIAESISSPGLSAAPAETVPLRAVKTDKVPRLQTGISEFDRVLGGGIVPGSVILLGGDPGIGKSTLVLEAAFRAAKTVQVLYVSGEESAEQVRLRADRLGAIPRDLDLLPETDVDSAVATALAGSYRLVIIDSIQSMRTAEIPAAAGSVSQVATSAVKLQTAAKSSGVAVILIGHVTKEGSLAGPKTLEHLVDVVLSLEGDRSGELRLLRGTKNRFGATGEIGLFQMTERGLEPVSDPSRFLIDRELGGEPGTVPTVVLEGQRPLAVEIQALSSITAFGYPRRTASGIDLDRLQLTAAVLGKRAGLPLQGQDLYVNVVGGVRVQDPGIGLPLALAVASAFRGRPLARGMMVMGEVGLSGEIRPVASLERRITEARRLGYRKFLVPARSGTLKGRQGVIPVSTLGEALKGSGIVE